MTRVPQISGPAAKTCWLSGQRCGVRVRTRLLRDQTCEERERAFGGRKIVGRPEAS